jgi:hypothetical protein
MFQRPRIENKLNLKKEESQSASQDNSFPFPLSDALRTVVHMASYFFNSAITSTIVRFLNSAIRRERLSTGETDCTVKASTSTTEEEIRY